MFRVENKLSELLIAVLSALTILTIVGGFVIFSFQTPTVRMLTPLIEMKYLGNSLYQWILMLSFTIIARELWIIRRKQQ